MYPPVTQFETREREVEEWMDVFRPRRRGTHSPPSNVARRRSSIAVLRQLIRREPEPRLEAKPGAC